MDYSILGSTLGPVKAPSMARSSFSQRYALFLRHLREMREGADITQAELARRLGITQSAVSKCERGERRLDVVELYAWCAALRVSFVEFARTLDRSWRS